MDFSEILKNPMIAQYLLGAGSGMLQNSQSMGQALAGGMAAGNASTLDLLKRQQAAAAEQQLYDSRRASEIEQQKQMYQFRQNADFEQGKKQSQYEQDQARTTSEREAIGYFPMVSKLLGEDTARNLPANIVNTIGKYGLEQAMKPDKATLKFNPVTGEGYIEHDSGKIDPFTGSAGNQASPSVAPTNSTSPVQDSTTEGPKSNGTVNIWGGNARTTSMPAPTTPMQEKISYEETARIAADGIKKQNEEKIKKDLAAEDLVNNNKTRVAQYSQTNKDIEALDKALLSDEQFRKNDKLWGNLPDSPLVNSVRGNVTENPNMKIMDNIISSNMFDKIQEMGEKGGVSKLFDSNAEKDALRATILDPTAPYQSKQFALNKLKEKYNIAKEAYERSVERAYTQLGRESPYQTLNTGNKPIGATGVMNGKKVRVVGQNRIEILE